MVFQEKKAILMIWLNTKKMGEIGRFTFTPTMKEKIPFSFSNHYMTYINKLPHIECYKCTTMELLSFHLFNV
jgi:hypothetical protein